MMLVKGEKDMDYTPLDLIADGSKLLVENCSMPRNAMGIISRRFYGEHL